MGDKHTDWSCLNQSLYVVTFITQGERDRGQTCVICLESNHTEEQCALYTPSHKLAPGKQSAEERGVFDMREPGWGKGAACMACFARSQGECRLPSCKYHHACVGCFSKHRIAQCPLLKGNKEGKILWSQS